MSLHNNYDHTPFVIMINVSEQYSKRFPWWGLPSSSWEADRVNLYDDVQFVSKLPSPKQQIPENIIKIIT